MSNFELPENCTPVDAAQVKVGHHVILKNRPCKIYESTHDKTGKHGHCRVSLVGIDLLNGKKRENSSPGHATLAQFEIAKEEFQLINMTEDGVECLDSKEVEQTISLHKDSEMYMSLYEEFQAGNTVTITVIKVPVVLSAKKSSIEQVIESFTRTKDE